MRAPQRPALRSAELMFAQRAPATRGMRGTELLPLPPFSRELWLCSHTGKTQHLNLKHCTSSQKPYRYGFKPLSTDLHERAHGFSARLQQTTAGLL